MKELIKYLHYLHSPSVCPVVSLVTFDQ